MKKLYIKKRIKYSVIVAGACCVYRQWNTSADFCGRNPSGYSG